MGDGIEVDLPVQVKHQQLSVQSWGMLLPSPRTERAPGENVVVKTRITGRAAVRGTQRGLRIAG